MSAGLSGYPKDRLQNLQSLQGARARRTHRPLAPALALCQPATGPGRGADCPHHRLRAHLHAPQEDQHLKRARRSEAWNKGGGRRHLDRQLHGLRSGIYRPGTENPATCRQPVRCKGVTHVIGTNCYPCLRAGHSSTRARSGHSGSRCRSRSVRSTSHPLASSSRTWTRQAARCGCRHSSQPAGGRARDRGNSNRGHPAGEGKGAEARHQRPRRSDPHQPVLARQLP